eukprot:TRINITY_DN9359_c1_g1_i1.p1 TRINITY_DN9359_c1_g1~~TRINITY_DN9359_c1_g1_i1.p1  ORF type:complete len:454 (-),score=80.93 TRINITY_DN9359_c1_g1_i1:332-1693(-)
MRVAIVGAGPSGLAACKAALEEGLQPTIFEKAAGIGGLWRQDESGKVWSSLKTNLSKYTCAFSDYPWPADAEDFPAGQQVQAYLERFSAENKLLQHARFDAVVTDIRKDSKNGGWSVSWKRASELNGGAALESEMYDKVVVAAGIFSRNHRGTLPQLECFQGRVMDSADYREPSSFAGERVLVIGSAFSGADIAAEVSTTAASVEIAAPRPIWYLPRYIGGKPADLAFYSRVATDRSRNASEEEKNQRRHNFFGQVLGDLPASVVKPTAERGDLPFVAITDAFLEAVKTGSVQPRATRVAGFDGKDVLFADGQPATFDAVIVATGYCLELPFFSEEVLQALDYRRDDLLQPLLLHECVWPTADPALEGLAFVGIYRGPYFAAMELQARWACGVFSGRLPAPSASEVDAGLAIEREIRTKVPRPQFPHGDYGAVVLGRTLLSLLLTCFVSHVMV